MTTHYLSASCSNRSFVIQQIPSSNLFMVVVDSSGRQDTEESILLGVDFSSKER